LRGDRLTQYLPMLTQAITALTSKTSKQVIVGAFLLITLVHVVETVKFVSAWTNYKTAVRELAGGTASDPSLGDPRFVSSGRIDADLNRLSWFSTTQYLSLIVANFAPSRLVVDPMNNYFWLSCDTATANYHAERIIPSASRDLVRVYSCLHR